MAFDAQYDDRAGYDEAFLRPGEKDGRVFLPTLGSALLQLAVTLLADKARYVLKYHDYSVVMHRQRRFAIYSAANVDFAGRRPLRRPKDVWRLDPRIDPAVQVTAAYYAKNQFDRGHLTRREDLEYGADETSALAAAADTCHWTNCTPQAATFNENKQLWQGLERHILENAVARDSFRAQVMTGPVFGADDPLLPGFDDVRYPLRYWKVVAAINAAGRLFSTAYLLDQQAEIVPGARGAPEVPFTPYKTFQTTIGDIERLTGLRFMGGRGLRKVSLRNFDPLAKVRSAAPRVLLRNARQIVTG